MPSAGLSIGIRAADGLGNLLLRPPVGGLGRAWTHGPRGAKRVALTYDDGPSAPSTHDVLDVLAAQGAAATFFCVGDNARRHPDIVRRAYRAGHAIGNHSMHHSRGAGLRPGGGAHIDDCSGVLADLLGVRPRLYRAPWGWLTPWETRRLLSRGLSVIGWDVYTYDWRTPPPDGDAIAAGIVRVVRPGSIVLLHDGVPNADCAERPQTARATEAALTRLRGQGYAFVTVPELLGLEPYDL